jgi:hypothetical protein
MTLLNEGRLTGVTHALLAQLAEPDALIVFATPRIESSPLWFFQQGIQHRIIPERSVDVLAQYGYILRCGSSVPIYRITQKGKEYLRIVTARHAFSLIQGDFVPT